MGWVPVWHMGIKGCRYGWIMSADQQARRIPWGPIVGLISFVLTVAMLASLLLVWSAVQGIRNPSMEQLPESASAVVVFAGEEERLALGRQLAEAGRASVLVLNATRLPSEAEDWCDGGLAGMEVICLVLADESTKGEAAAFGALAVDRGWTSLIGVTSGYHAQRARLWMDRCFSGRVSMAMPKVDHRPPPALVVREFLKIGHASTIERSCQ